MNDRRRLVLGAGLTGVTALVGLAGCGSAARRSASPTSPTPVSTSPPVPRAAPAGAGQPGPVLDGVFTDASRQRDIPWRLRLPAGEAPVAWVVFSHGLGGSLDAGTDWAIAWAQAGIATLHLQHAGSDSAVWRQGEAALRQAASGQQLVQRALDVRAAIDQVQRLAAQPAGAAAWRRLRADALGIAGHSFGSHTTMAVAGQQYGPGAPGVSLADPRPRAFAAFSPSPVAGAAPAQSFGAITRPVLCLTGSADADPLAPPDAVRASRGDHRRAVFDGLPPGDKAELWLDGADHMSFSGQRLDMLPARLARRPASAREQADRHQALIAAASTLWWQAQLLGDAAARRQLAVGPPRLAQTDDWRRG